MLRSLNEKTKQNEQMVGYKDWTEDEQKKEQKKEEETTKKNKLQNVCSTAQNHFK